MNVASIWYLVLQSTQHSGLHPKAKGNKAIVSVLWRSRNASASCHNTQALSLTHQLRQEADGAERAASKARDMPES